MDSRLRLVDVGVELGDRLVVRAVTAEVGPGELVAVIGPNGSGKTTLLRAVGGLVACRHGRVTVDGDDPAQLPRRQLAQRLALLPQRVQMAFGFVVEDVVRLGRTAHHRGPWLDDAADIRAAREAMARVGIEPLAHRRFDQLSGGEQRRVLLAQMLCQGARWLLLDEPTAALDPAHARGLFEHLRELVADNQHGAVVISHDLNLVARYASRVWLMQDGQLVEVGSPAQVLASEAAARAFELNLHVGTLPSGTPFVVPL